MSIAVCTITTITEVSDGGDVCESGIVADCCAETTKESASAVYAVKSCIPTGRPSPLKSGVITGTVRSQNTRVSEGFAIELC